MEKDVNLLSDDDKEVIRKKVEKKLEKEARAKAEEEYEKKLTADLKRKELMKDAKPGDPNGDGLVPVFIDIPRVSDCIRIEGTAYYPQKIYYVTPDVRDVLNETMARGRDHEDSLNGKTAKENLYRRTGQTVVR